MNSENSDGPYRAGAWEPPAVISPEDAKVRLKDAVNNYHKLVRDQLVARLQASGELALVEATLRTFNEMLENGCRNEAVEFLLSRRFRNHDVAQLVAKLLEDQKWQATPEKVGWWSHRWYVQPWNYT